MRMNHLARTAAIGLLASALVVAPAFALASDGTAVTGMEDTLITGLSTDANDYNADYVAGLRGLTDAERTELKGLLDARDRAWERGSDLDVSSLMRIAQLEHKSQVALAADSLSAAEVAELEKLYAAFDALPTGSYMDHTSWDRLMELEYACYGSDWDPITNDEQAAELMGVTEAERAEYAELGYRIDQDIERGITVDDSLFDRRNQIWEVSNLASMEIVLGPERFAEYQALVARLDSLPAGSYLTREEFDRLEELEYIGSELEEAMTTSAMAENVEGLTEAERAELAELLCKDEQDYRRDIDVSDARYERVSELYRISDLAKAKARLGTSEYAEYEAFEAKSYAGAELTDAEWERYFELLDKVYPCEC